MIIFRVCVVVNLCLSESVNLHTIANTVPKKKCVNNVQHLGCIYSYASDVGNAAPDVETLYTRCYQSSSISFSSTFLSNALTKPLKKINV